MTPETQPQKRRKGPKEPNPLSVKKKQIKPIPVDSDAQIGEKRKREDDGEDSAKKKRKRRKKAAAKPEEQS